jgi:hypothetical protein
MSFAAAGSALAAQTAGDCRQAQCDGAGQVVQVADATDAPASTPCQTWACSNGTPAVATAPDGTACPPNGACHAGSCVPYPASCGNGAKNGTETDIDCGGACAPCAAGKGCSVAAECANHTCSFGQCTWSSTCPGPAVGGPAASWASCSAGLDPTRNGGDLLWAESVLVYPNMCSSYACPSIASTVVGPTGDVALGAFCYTTGGEQVEAVRYDGSGARVGAYDATYGSTSSGWIVKVGFGPNNDIVTYLAMMTLGGEATALHKDGAPATTWLALWNNGLPIQSTWDADALGNVFGVVRTNVAQTLDAALHLPTPPGSPFPATVNYLVRGGALGESYQTDFNGSFAADQVGGVYRADALSAPLTLVTHLDGAGACVFGASFAAPGLTLAVDPGGHFLVSGLVGPAPVDLGGGPLLPLGGQDLVVGVLDAAGNPVWSRRFGGLGVTFTSPGVSATAAGDVYLLTSVSGTVDLGGGALAGTATVVGSYSAADAHRWSRAYAVAGQYQAHIDGCGALVLTSTDANFDPGCGQVIPPLPYSPIYLCHYMWPHPNAAIARFQP